MTSRISVDDALQNDFLPLPWKIRVIGKFETSLLRRQAKKPSQ